jgi:probable HAF family extracellular repeat protein
MIPPSQLLFRILSLFALVAATAPMAHAQPRYHLTDLGVITNPPQQNSYGMALNQQGQVAGRSEFFASRYSNGVQENLGHLSGFALNNSAYGRAINNLGAVAGYSTYDNGGGIRHAALFHNGARMDLGFLPNAGNNSFAFGINDQMTIVGHSGPSSDPFNSNTRAFIWDSSNGMRELAATGGGFAKAYAINNAGLVTGHAANSTPNSFVASIWDNTGAMRFIGTIDGNFSTGRAINANGHVAGLSTINDFDNRDHAFLYNGTSIVDLGSLGIKGAEYEGGDEFYSDRSEAYGINIYDHVVGTTYLPYAGGALYQVAFIYRDGQMHNLEALLDESGTGYRLGSASGINDKGQITSTASRGPNNDIRGVLLTPVPQVTAITRASGGVIKVQGQAQPNQSLRVERSKIPGSFTTEASELITATADGSFIFEETPAPGVTSRFYRFVGL